MWRARFIEYYKTNAPTKVALVTDEFMVKWAGKYDTLFTNLVKKYGEPSAQTRQCEDITPAAEENTASDLAGTPSENNVPVVVHDPPSIRNELTD